MKQLICWIRSHRWVWAWDLSTAEGDQKYEQCWRCKMWKDDL